MKKFTFKAKFLATFFNLFIVALSLMFAFLIPQNTQDNVFYWVMKGIALTFLVVLIIAYWGKNATFSKYFPLTLIATLYQGVPALCRINFDNTHAVATWIYFVVVILSFLFIISACLYAFSTDKFIEDENRAKPSSKLKR